MIVSTHSVTKSSRNHGCSHRAIHEMIMERNLDCTIRIIPMESLKRYYRPAEITAYCRKCPRYDLNWSCPPHDFDAMDYMAPFAMVYVMGIKVPLSHLPNKAEAMGYYRDCRHAVNQRLLQYEPKMPGAVVLIAGHCDICGDCSRQVSLACHHPDQRRYSFESLGFKVSEMVEDVFDDTLQWDNGKMPDHLYLVAGILSNSTFDACALSTTIGQL